MKKLIFASAIVLGSSLVHAQGLKGLLSKAGDAAKSTGLSKKSPTNLSNDEIVAGLKDALRVGSDKAASKVSVADGFFKDAVIKILMPEEAQKAESAPAAETTETVAEPTTEPTTQTTETTEPPAEN